MKKLKEYVEKRKSASSSVPPLIDGLTFRDVIEGKEAIDLVIKNIATVKEKLAQFSTDAGAADITTAQYTNEHREYLGNFSGQLNDAYTAMRRADEQFDNFSTATPMQWNQTIHLEKLPGTPNQLQACATKASSALSDKKKELINLVTALNKKEKELVDAIRPKVDHLESAKAQAQNPGQQMEFLRQTISDLVNRADGDFSNSSPDFTTVRGQFEASKTGTLKALNEANAAMGYLANAAKFMSDEFTTFNSTPIDQTANNLESPSNARQLREGSQNLLQVLAHLLHRVK